MTEPLPELMSILVVEDDAGDYGLLRAALRQAGLVAIVVLTGHDDPALAADTLEAGAQDYLV